MQKSSPIFSTLRLLNIQLIYGLYYRGIRVGYTLDISTDAVADIGVMLVLATTRRMIESWKHAQA